MSVGRVGVACKLVHADGTDDSRFKFQDLSRANYRKGGDQRLREIAFHNARTLHAVVCHMERMPQHLRMFRISNGVFPCLTLPEAQHAWRDAAFVNELERAYAVIGKRARDGDVRLSTHPDQFIIPNSMHADVRQRGIFELDQWGAWVARMGLGPEHGFCVNIHVEPSMDRTLRTLVDSWRVARKALSHDAWRVLTIENDDKVWTAHQTYRVCGEVGVRPVIDVHHDFCVSKRWPNAESLGRAIVPLWPLSRPKIHFSLPRRGFYKDDASAFDSVGMPRHDTCNGPRQPHAQLPWAWGSGKYLKELLKWSDVMSELKYKNAARRALFQSIRDSQCRRVP